MAFFHMANNFHCIGFVSKRGWMVNYQSDLPVNFKYDILDINKKDEKYFPNSIKFNLKI